MQRAAGSVEDGHRLWCLAWIPRGPEKAPGIRESGEPNASQREPPVQARDQVCGAEVTDCWVPRSDGLH